MAAIGRAGNRSGRPLLAASAVPLIQWVLASRFGKPLGEQWILHIGRLSDDKRLTGAQAKGHDEGSDVARK